LANEQASVHIVAETLGGSEQQNGGRRAPLNKCDTAGEDQGVLSLQRLVLDGILVELDLLDRLACNLRVNRTSALFRANLHEQQIVVG